MQKHSFHITVSDMHLLEEITFGNVKAFDIVFERYYKNLCRFAYQFTHDDDLSQGLVQDVFVKFWEKRSKLSQVDNLAGYLAVMVKNRCVDYRKKQRNIELLEDIEDSRSEDTTENQVYSANFEEKLIAALAKLPPRCREAFEYSRFESMSNKEIAKALGISVKGVEALIGRSLKQLRIELREFLPSFNLKDINPILFFVKLHRLARKVVS